MTSRRASLTIGVCAIELTLVVYVAHLTWNVLGSAPVGAPHKAQGELVETQESWTQVDSPDPVPLFPGMGTYSRPVLTRSTLTQKYCDQGLAFLYSFNNAAAERSYEEAALNDPGCAMAYWGQAISHGPYINNMDVDEDSSRAALEALEKARERCASAPEADRALIQAAGKLFSRTQKADRNELDLAYAAAMRDVWKRFPDDPDVGALAAEAVLNLRPWNQWRRDGKPQSGTEEVIEILGKVLSKSPQHPFALHLYIHALEASPYPERAQEAASRLRNLTPGLEHLVHMPSHIDIRSGNWNEAVIANEKALAADKQYREMAPEADPYVLSIAHDQHMLAYAAAMQGQMQKALHTVDEMLSGMPEEFVSEHADHVDGYVAMRYEFLLRFGQWSAMLNEPTPHERFPIARAFRHMARGVCFAATGQVHEAEKERDAFVEGVRGIPKDEKFRRNNVHALLAIGDRMLAGEILYRQHREREAIAALGEAVQREDDLAYTEPPNWILHVRHALGATLLDAGQSFKAEAVYREDLKRHPENGWSLHGLVRSLQMQKKNAEATLVLARFNKAWQHADFTITSSCCCLPQVKQGASR